MRIPWAAQWSVACLQDCPRCFNSRFDDLLIAKGRRYWEALSVLPSVCCRMDIAPVLRLR
jgi:hypothetical protein